MKIKQLFEAPVADFNHIGNFDNSHSFRDKNDRKLITSQKALEKIKSKWLYPEDVDVNIIFVNHPDGSKHTEVGFVTKDWLVKEMPRIQDQILPVLNDDAVNVIFTNNSGSERVPMTGWIMAHRLGHAIFRPSFGSGNNNSSRHLYNEAIRQLVDMLTYINKEFYQVPLKDGNGFGGLGDNRTDWRPLLYGVCKFKASRTRSLRNSHEAIHELFAQYLMTGKISFNTPKVILDGRGRRISEELLEGDVRYIEGMLRDYGDMIAEYFESAMGYAVGKILVM